MNVAEAASLTRGHVRLLQATWVTSAFDRFVIGPMLVTIAVDLEVSLDAAALAASLYFLGYGLSQPFWGACLDRFGRVRMMRVTLAAAAVAGVASALAPSLVTLVVARACTGVFIAGVIPAGLVYVGDMLPFRDRQGTLTDLNAALAASIAVAISVGGVIAGAVSWRVGFLVPAVLATALVVALRGLPEPPPQPGSSSAGMGHVLRHRWAWMVTVFALLEGAALLGCLTYLAPALESQGAPTSVAGLVVGLYGVGLLIASLVVKRMSTRISPAVFLAAGAAGLVVAYTGAALVQSPWVIGLAALLLGAAWAPMNSTMQTWATEAVAGARASMVSLFVAMVFIGSGVGTAALAPLADAGDWPPLFLVGAALAAVFGLTAPLARSRFVADSDASP